MLKTLAILRWAKMAKKNKSKNKLPVGWEYAEYCVRFSLPNEEGYWRNHEEFVKVLCLITKAKDSHDAAAKIIQDKYPQAKYITAHYI